MNEQLDPCQIEEKVTLYLLSQERFTRLPHNLKEIAIEIAIEVLSIKNEDLLLVAGEIDTQAYENEFTQMESEHNGSLLNSYEITKAKLLKRSSQNEADRISLWNLRGLIASRKSRARLAQSLNYTPGKYQKIVTNLSFQAANDLCWQAVENLSSARKLDT